MNFGRKEGGRDQTIGGAGFYWKTGLIPFIKFCRKGGYYA